MEEFRPAFPVADAVFQRLVGCLRKYRWSIVGALSGGLLAYLFAFVNKLPNFDDVVWMFVKGADLVSGRWGLIPLSLVFPDYSMPWIYGILSLLILAAGCCTVTEIFRIRTPLLQVLLSAAIVCFPSQIATFTYMFTASAYAVAFTLSVLAVRFLQMENRWGIPAALACLVYAVSIYQAYVAITSTLLILLLVQALLQDRESAGVLLRRGVGYVIFLGAAMAVYWGITKLLWQITGTGMGDYASYAFSVTPESLLEGFRLAYRSFGEVLRYGVNGLMPTFASRILHILCFLAVGLEAVLWMLRSRDPCRILLMLFLLLILPLSLNCVYLFIAPDAIHTLVLYSYAMLYVLFALVAESRLKEGWKPLALLRQLGREGLVLAMAVITVINIYIANEAYLNMHLAYENTYSVTNSVISMVQALPDYTREEPVAILGQYEPPEYYREHFARLDRLVATCGIKASDYSAEAFWQHYCGYPAVFATKKQRQELMQTEDYARMPSWPDAGCVRRIGDVIAVKFS